MKAMILSAGRGERMRPLTLQTPKPLLKAGNKRLIEYIIDALVAANINDIIINYAHLGEQFPQVLGNGDRYQANIQYSPEPDGPYETAGGIIHALPLLGDEPFLIVNGDIWTDYNFSHLAQLELADKLCHLVLVTNPEHNPTGDFAINHGLLTQQGQPRFTYSGIAVYQPALFKEYTTQTLALKPLLLKAIEQQKATAELYSGQWSDIGNVARLQQLDAHLS